MNNPHLNDDQLIGVLYGVGSPAYVDHASACADCERRKLVLMERRRMQTTAPAISNERLRVQHRTVRERAANPQHRSWGAPALAAGAVAAGLVVGMLFTAGSSNSVEVAGKAKQPAVADDVDLSEVLAIDAAVEARAAAPLRGLFEEDR